MKHFLIKYRREHGTQDEWHREIARFISALDNDPALAGKISYRCMNGGGASGYYHLASVTDDNAAQALQERDYFKHYTGQTKLVSGGKVEVLPLEIIAETKHTA